MHTKTLYTVCKRAPSVKGKQNPQTTRATLHWRTQGRFHIGALPAHNYVGKQSIFKLFFSHRASHRLENTVLH